MTQRSTDSDRLLRGPSTRWRKVFPQIVMPAPLLSSRPCATAWRWWRRNDSHKHSEQCTAAFVDPIAECDVLSLQAYGQLCSEGE
jgi:hypothetical protein